MEDHENPTTEEVRGPSKKQKTKRGAKHIRLAPKFRSKAVLPMTPAQYRRYHFGAKQEE